MLYLMLFIACIAVELSSRINTNNCIKKVGIGFIAVGALVSYAQHSSEFIEVGVLIYLVANIISAYAPGNHRRGGDL